MTTFNQQQKIEKKLTWTAINFSEEKNCWWWHRANNYILEYKGKKICIGNISEKKCKTSIESTIKFALHSQLIEIRRKKCSNLKPIHSNGTDYGTFSNFTSFFFVLFCNAIQIIAPFVVFVLNEDFSLQFRIDLTLNKKKSFLSNPVPVKV